MSGLLPAGAWAGLSGACFAVLAVAYRYAGSSGCRPKEFAAVFLFTGMLVSAPVAVFQQTVWADPRLWLVGAGMGVAVFSAIVLVAILNRLGPASVVWTVINLSLFLTVLLARLVYRERLLPVDGVVLVLFGAMVACLCRGTTGETTVASWKFWLLLILAYVLNGLFSFGMKVKQELLGSSSSAGLAAVFYGCGAVLSGAWVLAKGTRRLFPKEWTAGIFAGIFSAGGNILFLASMTLPPVVAFPVAQGTSLVGGVALVSIVFKERLSPTKVVGWILGVCVLILALLREPCSRWMVSCFR